MSTTRRVNRKGLDMPSTMMTLVRQIGCASKTFNTIACAAVIGLAGFAMTVSPASALVTGAGSSLRDHVKDNNPIVEVVVRRGGAAHRTTVVGPRGGVASRTTVRRGAMARPAVGRAVVGRPGGWVRPAHYTWRPGGAIAAGAAVGFVAAATAASWAGAAPAPGYCWYYTDPSQRQGFWDVCP
jgi:hypothetical protein